MSNKPIDVRVTDYRRPTYRLVKDRQPPQSTTKTGRMWEVMGENVIFPFLVYGTLFIWCGIGAAFYGMAAFFFVVTVILTPFTLLIDLLTKVFDIEPKVKQSIKPISPASSCMTNVRK